MKALLERNYTLTELSAKLGMSAPTIKEHANILVGSGIIEQQDEGRKWKYYSLTRKGRDILEAKQRQTNILIILSCSGVLLAGLLLMFSGAMLGANYSPAPMSQGPDAAGAQPILSANDGAMPAASGETNKSAPTSPPGAAKRAQFNCNPTYAVDNSSQGNSGISATEYYARKCHEQTTEKGCLAVDYFNSERQDFSSADGMPDCEWSEFSS